LYTVQFERKKLLTGLAIFKRTITFAALSITRIETTKVCLAFQQVSQTFVWWKNGHNKLDIKAKVIRPTTNQDLNKCEKHKIAVTDYRLCSTTEYN